jgi:hypothetical protein
MYSDIWGAREEKYARLLSSKDNSHESIEPSAPLWLLYPTTVNDIEDYEAWPLLTDWMPLFSNGIETHKDGLTVHFTPGELSKVVEQLFSLPLEEARAVLGVGNDGRDWSLSKAVKSLKTMTEDGQLPGRITYRPFDVRYTMLNKESGGFIAYPRWDVMSNLVNIEDNVGLVSARLKARGGQWDSCLATRFPTEKKTGDSTRSSTTFPLFVNLNGLLGGEGEIKANLSPRLVAELQQVCSTDKFGKKNQEARDIYDYLYSLLHSPIYRERYEVNLRTNFPRLPLPSSFKLFSDLAHLGNKLVSLYLLDSVNVNNIAPTFLGPDNPAIGRIGWSDDTVWLDAGKTEAKQGHRASRPGTVGFKGVPKAVWEFHIGGYQVCHKWLKDRKGRTLSEEDIIHYQKIIVALNETIRIMGEIDEVIEEHGGWPDAFVTQAN